MPEVIPRWEWRSFGGDFGDADERLREEELLGIRESDEIYLLSPSLNNIKIRDGLVDIKLMRDVNENGLEQWMPVLKAEFPLTPAAIAGLFEALGLPVPERLRNGCTLETLLGDLLSLDGIVQVVKVHKRRNRYLIDGCMAEFSEILVDGRKSRTLAVESADPEAVVQLVVSLGLGDYLNTSYPRGLADILEEKSERYAAIDVGTNSVKFHIGEWGTDGCWHTVTDRAEVTRLGEGLAKERLVSEAAMARTSTAISGMLAEARRAGVRAIAAVGTAGLRIAGNATEVVAAIKAGSGVQIDVISGEEESRLAFMAARDGLGLRAGSLVVFDTGGGSSQFTFGHNSKVDEQFSVDVGAARYAEHFRLDGAVTTAVVGEAMEAIAADLSRLVGRPAPDALVGMGGAVTNMITVKHGLSAYDPRTAQGAVLESSEVDRQIDLYRSLDGDARRRIPGLQAGRAEIILAGACIVRTILRLLGKNSLRVSDRGLRHGLLVERFTPRPGRHDAASGLPLRSSRKKRKPREEN